MNSSNTVEKILQNNTPIHQPEISRFSSSNQLPGLPFKPNFNLRINFDNNGNLRLGPGDYLIPVMTYCMNSEGASPEAHPYFLSKMQGSRAQVIRDLNLRALPQFSYEDVQILSWSLQNGMKYDDLTAESKRIVDTILPEYKNALKDSLLELLGKKWDESSAHSEDIIPLFSETVGAIAEIKSFQNALKEVGNNYEALSKRIRVLKNSGTTSENIPWSHISENVYARFITRGHYQDLGQIQIRVTGQQSSSRNPNLEVLAVAVDLLSWLADPNKFGIQALSFSPIYGFGGVLVLPALADAPVLAVAVLGAVLAAEIIDWNTFEKLSQLLRNVKDQEVQKKIAEGLQVLNEKHDRLEKPLREKGILDKKTKKTSTNENSPTREYTKHGGQKALNKDFEKLDGPSQKVDDIEVKQDKEGIKAVKRPPKDGQDPTLEMQPTKTGNRVDDSTRIKVRYKL